MEVSKFFNQDVHYTIFCEHISDPRSYILFVYGDDNIGLAYNHSLGLYVPVHLTENVFNWSGESDYRSELIQEKGFLICDKYIIAHQTGVCTGFTIPFSDDITAILRPSMEVLVVVTESLYRLYHINGHAYYEVDNVFIINQVVFTKKDDHFICVDDLFTKIYDIDEHSLATYPYVHPRLDPFPVSTGLQRFIDNHGFSKYSQ